jgi:hypothetical protein
MLAADREALGKEAVKVAKAMPAGVAGRARR